MTDHFSDWPLWCGGGTGQDAWPMLSDDLQRALNAWNEFWYDNFDLRDGWAPGTHNAFIAEGQRLRDALELELGSDYEVRLVV